jgi:cysteine desulfurase
VETAREALASKLGVDARDVIFTSGGSEANNLALHGAPALVTSRLEHPSVVRAAERLGQQREVRWLPVPATGRLEPESLAQSLAGLSAGSLVSVMAANHETGVIQPISAIAEAVHGLGHWLHVDAVQAFGKIGLDQYEGFDLVTVSAHKIRGPKGIGALAFRAGRAPSPLLVGGQQQRGLRAGTQDPALAAGLLAALERLDQRRYQALAPLRDRLESKLMKYATLNGVREPRLPHVSNLSFDGWRGDELVAALDLLGVRVASGAACSAGTSERSPVITQMLGSESADRAVRISLGETTTEEDVERAVKAFETVLHRQRSTELSDAT